MFYCISLFLLLCHDYRWHRFDFNMSKHTDHMLFRSYLIHILSKSYNNTFFGFFKIIPFCTYLLHINWTNTSLVIATTKFWQRSKFQRDGKVFVSGSDPDLTHETSKIRCGRYFVIDSCRVWAGLVWTLS